MCTDLDVGEGLLQRWAAAGEVVAGGPPWTPPWRTPPALVSSVVAHRVQQHRHDGEDAFYVAHNLYVDPTRRVRVRRGRTGGPQLSIRRGAFRLSCRPTASWAPAPAPLTLGTIKKSLRFGRPPPAPIDDVPTLFVGRDGASNVFHAMADLVNAYLVRRMVPYERIVFLDDHEDGPLMPLWGLLTARPVERFHELGTPRILRTAVFSPPGGCAFLWKNHWEARGECRRESALLRDFREFVLQRARLAPPAPARVTLVRRPPGGDGTGTRRIANEAALASGLRTLDVPVDVVDFAALPCREQIRQMLVTRVLVGVTGAGLTNLLWLEASAGVVELVATPSYAPAVFGNLAAWRGIRHATWRPDAVSPEAVRLGANVPEITVDVPAVVSLVADMLA